MALGIENRANETGDVPREICDVVKEGRLDFVSITGKAGLRRPHNKLSLDTLS